MVARSCRKHGSRGWRVIDVVLLVALALMALASVGAPARAAGEYVFEGQWGEEGTAPGQLYRPNDIALDHGGNLWVVSNGWTVQKFTVDGVFALRLPLADDMHYIAGLAADASGNVYLADSNNFRIRKFDTNGNELIAAFGGYGTGDGQFKSLTDVAVDRDGFVYAADGGNTRIQKFTSAGAFVAKFSTGTGIANLSIDVDGAGNIYASDDTCNDVVITGCKVHKFAPNGTPQGAWGGYDADPPTAGMFRTPLRIAADTGGNQFITDNAAGDSEYARVQKFSPTGTFITKISAQGLQDGEYAEPTGIDVDERGSVFIADSFWGRVMTYRPAGTDVIAPVITSPGKLTHEATSGSGVAVSYTVRASDAVDGSVTPACSPASGSTFPIGTTLVTCSASDKAGNRATAAFEIVVTHLGGPVLSLPAPITAQAATAAGAVVAYTVSAIDAVDGAVSASCAPASGSTFAIGTTTVHCAAKDRAGNTGSGTFSVTVKPSIAPTPDLGKTVVAGTVSGSVTVKPPGARRFSRLTPSHAVILGSTIDTSRGRLRIRIARPKGGPWQAEVWGGLARLTQGKTGMVEVTLSGTAPGCKGRTPKTRKLWVSTSGPLRTHGLYATATPLGGKLATWLMEDRCGATYVRVTKGMAAVRDTGRKKAVTVTVKSGRSYLARKR